MTTNWTEKYKPKKFEEIKGQDEAVSQVKNFISRFAKGKKAIILHGPTGTGKTSLVYALANETNLEIFELNASDFRDKEKLQTVLKPALQQQSLAKKGKIILIDELDGISGYYDKGGVQELIKLIEESEFPIIMTANDIWSDKLSELRKKIEIIKMKEINYKIIKESLIEILRKENLFIDNNILTSIAINAKGDLRAAINDLQAISRSEKIISKIDERNKEKDIFNSLRTIFKDKANNELLNIFDSVNMPIDEIILWVEENMPLEYYGEELSKACDLLSKVDIFRKRIHRQQYWRFLVYENSLLSYGISASKNPKNIRQGFTSYKKPTRILKIWMNNQRTLKKKSIASKYSQYVHIGQSRAMKEFPLIKQILKSPKVQKELKLNDEEIEYLKT